MLHTGIAWEDLPREYGYRFRGDVLAAAAGLAAGRRVGCAASKLLVKLNAAGKIDWSRAVVDASHVRAL